MLIILVASAEWLWSLPRTPRHKHGKGEAKDAIPRIHPRFTRRNE